MNPRGTPKNLRPPWKKGQSGNPRGRPPAPWKEWLADEEPEVLGVLMGIMVEAGFGRLGLDQARADRRAASGGGVPIRAPDRHDGPTRDAAGVAGVSAGLEWEETMWPGEGLGASRDNLSTNLARLKNLRLRFTRIHSERDAVLAEIQASTEDAADTGDILLGEAPSYPIDQEPSWTHGMDLHWLAQDEREWLRNEHHSTLEMMFIYLIGVLDAFSGQWGVERKLWPEGTWPAATPENFRDRAGLTIRPAAARQLAEYRARRDVPVHRGGIADAKYCARVCDDTRPGQRLPVSESYLDTAVEFVDHLAAATAVAGYAGPPRHETQDWSPLIARVFEKVKPPTSHAKARGHRRARRSRGDA